MSRKPVARLTPIAAAVCLAVSANAQDSTGLLPVYPNGTNPPTSVPVIDEGSVLLCIGMSQANDECSGERQDHIGGWRDLTTLPVIVVNGGIDGSDVRKIIIDPEAYWTQVDQRILDAGYTNNDVQLIWGKNATRPYTQNGGSGDLMTERTVLRDHLILIQEQAEARFPNLRAGFHSSRIYGGYCPLNGEPFSHDTVYAIEGWDTEPGAIDSSSKWYRGPYLWADGIVQRDDGLQWFDSDVITDGCHPSTAGIQKVVDLNEAFFHQLTYVPPGSPPPPPAPPPPAPPPPAPPPPAPPPPAPPPPAPPPPAPPPPAPPPPPPAPPPPAPPPASTSSGGGSFGAFDVGGLLSLLALAIARRKRRRDQRK